MSNALPVELDPQVIEQLGRELDEIYESTIADLGERDERYIRRLIRTQRSLALGSRIDAAGGRRCAASVGPRTRAGRTGGARVCSARAGLGLAKILENMEIGHNVMHGQWDWMRDPEINSTTLGVGHGLPRRPVEARAQRRASHLDQRARHGPRHRLRDHADHVGDSRGTPCTSPSPSTTRCWPCCSSGASGLHELDLEKLAAGTAQEKATQARAAAGLRRKAARQVAKDYVLWPALAGPGFLDVRGGRRRREPDPQRVVLHDHLLRPLPRWRARVRTRGRRGRDRGPVGTSASCSARPTSTAAGCSTSSPAT